MNYALIRKCDIANGEGVRVSLFVSGCTHRCKGCFNEDAQDFAYGKPFTREVEDSPLPVATLTRPMATPAPSSAPTTGRSCQTSGNPAPSSRTRTS